ncbi:right-handed parallel beta-helix repeat-containing protein [Diaminobutyricibacter sp. McL0618]|uniref:right-handed parallel beta-helix repeat-containing protein n=1 Tax=Leifsonia sp. McL0618 TaxID=3415677 RepID=UPI003CE83208
MGLFAAAPAQAAPTAVTCGQTVVHNVILQSDLVCPAWGLVIGADRLDVNLNGHTITGPITDPSVGVDIGNHTGTTIRNGTVRGFGTGTSGNGAHYTVVSGMTFVNTVVTGVLLVDSQRNTVRMTHVTHDAGDPNYAAILLYHSGYNVIALNVLTFNGDGILLDGASHNTIAGNTSSDSGAGVDLVNSSDDNTITANRTDLNGDSGVLLDQQSNGNRITLNTAAGNGFGGVVVGASDHNTVLYNITNNNAGSGVVVTDNAVGTLVQGNRASGNGANPPGCTPFCPLLDDGIHVDAATTLLRANTADNNADLGIDAVAGVVDGGGNEAHGNGNPAQCAVVLCRP